MKITIASLEVRNSATKGDYAYGKGVINKKDGTEKPVTIMSFGAQFASVRDTMVAGATLDVNAVFDGGTLKVLSPYVAKSADEAQAA
jgi:hypothetical protein